MIDTPVRVGGVRSIVTTLPSITAVFVTPGLLAKSSNTMLRLAAPSTTWVAITVYVALQLVSLPTTVPARPAIDIEGSTMISLASRVNVIVSPAFARAVSATFDETMLMAVRVGAVRSIVTALPSVTPTAVSPALPAKSLKSTVNVDTPSTT